MASGVSRAIKKPPDGFERMTDAAREWPSCWMYSSSLAHSTYMQRRGQAASTAGQLRLTHSAGQLRLGHSASASTVDRVVHG